MREQKAEARVAARLDKPGKTIGIIIPTHNRYAKLRKLLSSMSRNWNRSIETVAVVDDSAEPIDLEAEFSGMNLHHVVLPKRVFISKAKNIGWKSLRTDYVYFIDDDNEVDESTFDPIFQVISTSPTIGALMPAVLYKKQPNLVWVYATPLGRDSTTRLVGRNLPRNGALENRLLNTDALPNASIVRRECLEQVGGFDESLVVNSSMDLCLRMKARKWKVFSYSGAFVYHDVEPPGKFGWWATHGASDPERVRYEIRDWFIIMHRLQSDERPLSLRTVARSKFVIPNMLAYMVRGQSRSRLAKSLLTGYLEGYRITRQRSPISYKTN